ncbi:MAG: hypothetical protein NDJ90_14850 [Oligoflexia bacterium]|nr:hypothetical protein [Oligoflexia bacterium]
MIQSAIKRSCAADTKWKFIKAIKARIVRQKGTELLKMTYLPERRVSLQPLEEAQCSVIGSMKPPSKQAVYRCEIDQFGSVELIAPEL